MARGQVMRASPLVVTSQRQEEERTSFVTGKKSASKEDEAPLVAEDVDPPRHQWKTSSGRVMLREEPVQTQDPMH